MAIRLSEQEILALIAEPKALPSSWEATLRLKPKRGHTERDIDLKGADGNDFRLILRQSNFNILDFSVILAYLDPDSYQVFRLRRCNGRSHEHTNHLEGQTFYDFHIHMATDRYQRPGSREDEYAEPTDRYADFDGALHCLFEDASFVLPPDTQPRLL